MDDATLELYKKQLEQVNQALENQSNKSDAKDLLQLRDDLTQLLGLYVDESSENHSAVVKSKNSKCAESDRQPVVAEQNIEDELSAFYNDISQVENENFKKKNENNGIDNELANFYSEISSMVAEDNESSSTNNTKRAKPDIDIAPSDTQNEAFLDSIEYLDDISGVKCQAPFTTEWSGTQYHNAMIQGPVEENVNADGDIKIKVLFLNPTMHEMQPCPYYLEGKCKFDQSGCRYSHGYVVSLYKLQLFVSPNYSNLTEGSKCLAKTNEGLWKPAVVVKVEDGQYSVEFLHKSPSLTLDLHDLLPETDHTCAKHETEIDSDDDILVEIAPQNLYKEYGASCSKGMPPSLGLWEEHTRGIGSKLMQKMGYKLGEGLGKNSQGRLEPVPIVLLPVGKSLDHCMELREKKGVKHVGDNGQKSQNEITKSKRKKHHRCVFSFLNKTLGDQKSKKDSSKNHIEKPKDMFGIKAGTEQKHVKNYNKQMMKNEDEMKKIKAKVNKVEESLRRNQSNPSVVKSLKEKLDKLKQNLKNMKEFESNIKIHKSRMETHRKMTTF